MGKARDKCNQLDDICTKQVFTYKFFSLQGWYIVTYALGIYHLNLFIAFLTPKIDPALEELGEEDLGVLTFVNCI